MAAIEYWKNKLTPYDAKFASNLCDPSKYLGNNKSEWIKKLATAAAYIFCEIETIQRKKGDGII